MARHSLRRRYGRAAMAAGRIKWVKLPSGAYTADGLWGSFRIRPPLGSHSKGYVLIWGNLYGYPATEDDSVYQELGRFSKASLAMKAAQVHVRLLKSTAVG